MAEEMKRCRERNLGSDPQVVSAMLLSSLLSGQVANAGDESDTDNWVYFCPKINSLLHEEGSAAVARASAHPPRSLGELRTDARLRIELELKDCSNTEYLCAELVTSTPGDQATSTLLFVPRTIERLREYAFEGTRAVVSYPAATDGLAQGAQILLWRSDGSQTSPISLTAVPKRGIVYIDGLTLPSLDTPDIGTCVLQSKHGLFRQLRVARDKTPPDIR